MLAVDENDGEKGEGRREGKEGKEREVGYPRARVKVICFQKISADLHSTCSGRRRSLVFLNGFRKGWYR